LSAASSSPTRSSCPPPTSSVDATALDRIDEIVKPGVVLNRADTSYGEQVLPACSAPTLAAVTAVVAVTAR
jgi:hypothetical protein